MKRLVPIMAALLAAGCGVPEPMPKAAAFPTVRLSVIPGRPAAGYFELEIEGDLGALESVTSPQARRIEMHETISAGNMTSMHRIERIPVRDGERLDFTPGGRHLMLFDVDPAIRPGGQIMIVLHFERGGASRPMTFQVISAGGGSH